MFTNNYIMCYINNKIQKVSIPNKGFGFVATKNIHKGEILIKDIPFTVSTDEIFSDIFQLIYQVVINIDILTKFMKLQPKSLNDYTIDHVKVLEELDKVKKHSRHVYSFFTENYNTNEILLLCAKYMCNAFNFNNKPALLLNATILNHSCIPNTIFGEVNGKFIFKAISNINKGEEIYDNYIDITLSKQIRQKHLLGQYGFVCSCVRCCETNDKKIKNYDEFVVGIEKERLHTFGFTKSQKC